MSQLKHPVQWVCCCCLIVSDISDSVWAYGLQPARLLWIWDSPGKNTGVCCHAILQGTSLTQGLNPRLLNCRQILYCWATRKAFSEFSCCSVAVVSDSLWPHGLQHASLPCPSLSPGACSNLYPLSQWFHPTISSTIVPFSSCLPSFLVSGSFLMSQLFA